MNAEAARSALDEAIKIHAAHLKAGTATRSSQMKMMDLMKMARTALQPMVHDDLHDAMTAHREG